MSDLLCGANGSRTSDTRIFSPLLYQLSYGTFRVRQIVLSDAEKRVQRYGNFTNYANYRALRGYIMP